jgi:hypothetical protein
MTARAKRKRVDSQCICHPEVTFTSAPELMVTRVCKYGYCNEWRCVACGGFLAGFGPATCRCDGAPRWAWHTGMAPGSYRLTGKIALKPSIAKRRQ